MYRKAYSSGEAASRDVFYANLYELQGVIGLNHGTVVSLVGKNREQIASLAKTDIAYRYALEWLDPFVVTDDWKFVGGEHYNMTSSDEPERKILLRKGA